MNSERKERDAIEVDRSLGNSDENRELSAEESVGQSEAPRPEEAMLYCPVCSTKLVQSRCKLVCQRCGYYMSCADYY